MKKNKTILKIFLFNLLIHTLLIVNNSSASIIRLQNDITLSGTIKNLSGSDTMYLYYWKDYLSSSRDGIIGRSILKCKIVNGRFSFSINNMEDIVNFSLGNTLNERTNSLLPILKFYIAEPGDSIYIDLDSNKIHFSGKGSQKYVVKKMIDSIERMDVKIFEKIRKTNPDPNRFYICCKSYNSIAGLQLDLLKYYKKFLTPNTFKFFLSEIIGFCQYSKLRFTYNLLSNHEYNLPNSWVEEIKLNNVFHRKKIYLGNIKQDKVATFSNHYISYLILKAIIETKLYKTSLLNPYTIISRSYKGILKEKLLTAYFLSDYGYLYGNLHKDLFLKHAQKTINNKYYRKLLSDLHQDVKLGNKAYNFMLVDEKGQKTKLSEFASKIVIMDFWFTGCGACTLFYRDVLSHLEEEYKNDSTIVFVTISPDANTEIWKKSIASNMYTSSEKRNVFNLHSVVGFADSVFKHYNIASMPYHLIIRKGILIAHDLPWDIASFRKRIELLRENNF